MAVQGISTLADIDFRGARQAHKAKRESDFKSRFASYIKGQTTMSGPTLAWDGNMVKFSGGGAQPYSRESLWNLYKRSAENKGVMPDLNYYTDSIEPMLAQQSREGIYKQVSKLTNLGVPPSKIKKAVKNNPDLLKALQDAIAADPSLEQYLAPYTQIYEKGLGRKMIEDPGGLVMPGLMAYGGYKGYKAASPYLKSLAAKGGVIGGLGSMARGLPMAAAYMGAEPIARALGAPEEQAKNISRGVIGGIGGLYGAQAGRNIARNRLAAGLASGTAAELKKTAGKLGMKGTSKLKKAALQKGIGEQVAKQGVRATGKKVGQSALQKALLKFGTKAAAKQVAGSALPFWGNLIAMGLTIPDVIALSRTMFSGEE